VKATGYGSIGIPAPCKRHPYFWAPKLDALGGKLVRAKVGPDRRLYSNAPFLPSFLKRFEVQVPVRPKPPGKSQEREEARSAGRCQCPP
jgi:hypothetical protein